MEIPELINGLENFLKPITEEVITKTFYPAQALFNIKLISEYNPQYLSINLKLNSELTVKLEATNNNRLGTAYSRLIMINNSAVTSDVIKTLSKSSKIGSLSNKIIDYITGKPVELD